MEKMFEKIISEGKKSGKSIEEINAELKAAGANFHLNPDGGVAGWTDAEMEEGFIPAEEKPKEATDTIQSSQNEGSATEQSGISGFFSKVADSITGAAAGAVEKLRNVLNRFLEALAVMLVTTCLIPILVLLFFVWLVKLILGVELPPLGMPRRSGEKIGGGEV